MGGVGMVADGIGIDPVRCGSASLVLVLFFLVAEWSTLAARLPASSSALISQQRTPSSAVFMSASRGLAHWRMTPGMYFAFFIDVPCLSRHAAVTPPSHLVCMTMNSRVLRSALLHGRDSLRATRKIRGCAQVR